MGDLCDTPIFKRSLLKKLGGLKVVVIALVLILASMAWAFSEEGLGAHLLLKFNSQLTSISRGDPYTLTASLKNEAEKTMDVEIQAVLYAKESTCVEPGKHLGFSNSIKVRIVPNGTTSNDLNFDSVSVPCEMSLGIKTFVNGAVDGKRFPLTQETNLSLHVR